MFRPIRLGVMAGLSVLAWAVPGYCDFVSLNVTDLKSPATFYTGKFINVGELEYRIVSTSAGDGLGMEPGWIQSVNLVSASGVCDSATLVTNDLSTSTLSEPSGRQDYTPQFYILRPFTGQSVRFQVTVTSGTVVSPGSGSVLGRACSADIDVFDYELSSLQILQTPPIFVVNSTVTVSSATGVKLFVVSTSAGSNFGLESWMRLSVDLMAGTTTISSGVSAFSPSLTPGATFYFPSFYPKYSSGGSLNLRYAVTVTSADASSTVLVPRLGVNPVISTIPVGVSPGDPSKLVLLPLEEKLVRPGTLGRAQTFDITNPKQWTPVSLGAPLPVQVVLTDSWSNPVDVVFNTNFITFDPAEFLELPVENNTGGLTDWLLSPGYFGTGFEFNMVPWEIPVPITVTSPDGFASDTIYISKSGLPGETIFAGPSPFNPKIGETIRFGFRVAQDQSVKIRVLDLFGRQLWETSVQATAGFLNTSAIWNGRNGNGELVGAGVYWVVLEVDGEWKSKKKFGVIK